MVLKYFILSVLLLLSVRCSSSKQNIEEDSGDNSVYVFDEVPLEYPSDSAEVDTYIEYNYFIQIGAFATENNAELYATECTEYISEELEVIYNDKTSLYLVRLKTFFQTQNEAERVRDRIRNNEKFSDAWIGKIQR